MDGVDKVLDAGTGGEDLTKVARKSVGRLVPAQSAGTTVPTTATASGVQSLSSSSSSSLAGLSAASSVSTESLTTPATPNSLPQPAQLSLVVASAVQGASAILTQDCSGNVGVAPAGTLKVSLQARRAKAASKLQVSLCCCNIYNFVVRFLLYIVFNTVIQVLAAFDERGLNNNFLILASHDAGLETS